MTGVTTTPRVVGLSSDGRTNRWRVTCPVCEQDFTPSTTRLSTQTFTCPRARCQAELFADYNAEPPIVTVCKHHD